MEKMMATASLKTRVGPGRSRAQDIDRYVGARMRERRIMLGLTQQQMAELIGVTYQQAHKYEKGINRIAAGRLFTHRPGPGRRGRLLLRRHGQRAARSSPRPQQRMLLELARNFISMPSRKHQEAICNLARALSNPELIVVPRDRARRWTADPRWRRQPRFRPASARSTLALRADGRGQTGAAGRGSRVMA